MKKITCVMIIRPEYGTRGYIVPLENLSSDLLGEFDGAEIGDSVVIKLVEAHSKKELEEMQEFEGW